ncbi:heavy-metal-associated domain-containing protein [Rhodohalobacter sp. 614A]|uniref:heavy-metal-associated domain-containing protein n=1 Tax=Rhodohalobacter sp. 614A TaxID=2908649 RepID=UPI001F181A33|nr:heavy-metal-associated domain-containing protein [Rhodohalobacter sp. 614A]
MKTLTFKTDIQCSGCVSTVTPYLDKQEGIHEWSVDLDHKDRILTVQTENMASDQIKKAIKEAGYSAEEING